MKKQYFFANYPSFLKSDELNIFNQVAPSEPIHSKIISELLNPNGRHGFGNLFLSIFFKCLDIAFENNNRWEVTAEKERFDIRIRNSDNTCIIIIENKSNWAEDQPNQIYRYWYYGIYLPQLRISNSGIKTNNYIYYLSPNDYKVPSENSLQRPNYFDKGLPDVVPTDVNIIFFNNEIRIWLSECLLRINQNTNTYFYIKQYLSFWSN